jgi:hypothetical protein
VLLVTNFELLEARQFLVKLQDDKGYAGSAIARRTAGWGTPEEHKDPSRCSGIAVALDAREHRAPASGEIAKNELQGGNLLGR